MNERRRISGLLLAVCCWAGLGAPSAQAAEPVNEFLDGLRARGLHDVIILYLDSLQSKPYVPKELKDIVPYEQGKALIDSSRHERDLNQRLKVLAQAREKFQEFITKNSQHELLGLAQLQLGNLMVEEAQVYFEKSKKPGPDENKDDLLKQSRDMFAQAIKTLDNAANEFHTKWKAFPSFIDPKETARIQARRNAQTNYIQALMFGGLAVQTSAKTWPAESKEYKDGLNQAAERFRKVIADFRMQYAGRYAMMLEGGCHQDLGDVKRALGLYREVLDGPGEGPQFEELKAKTLRMALEGYLDPSQKMYEEVVKRGEEWLRTARADLEQSPEGLAIAYFTAKAYHEMKLRDENSDDPKKKNEVRTYPDLIVKHVKNVSSVYNEFQQPARELMALYLNVDPDKLPESFAEARDIGKQALDVFQAKGQELSAEQAKGSKADKKRITDLTQERDQALADAVKFFNLAISLRDEKTTADDLNVVRYFLAYLYYSAGRYHEAAVMGEFLATHYPESAGAKHGAKIALVAHLANYNFSSPNNREWDAAQMVRVAQLITKNWKGEPEADEAWMMLGQIAIKEQDLTQAAEYLSNIQDNSPRKADADLQAGQALWSKYLSSRTLEPKPPQEELDELRTSAEARLKAGIQAIRAQSRPVNYDLLAGELSLAQIYVDSGRNKEALAALEVEKGVKELLDKKDPVTKTTPRFATQGYQTLLRAYVGDAKIDQALKVMGDLESLSKDDPTLSLATMYRQLGEQIEEQIKAESDPQKVQQLTQSFGAFLERIASAAQDSSFDNLGWVGEMLFRMGSGIDRPGNTPPEARGYYDKAKGIYERMLAMPAEVKPEKADLGLKVRISKCKRRLGDYKSAINDLIVILQENDKLLEAQMEAAYTFEEWGDNEDPKYYSYAMLGYRDRSGKQIVWGWGQLANIVQRQANLRDTYYEARYNVANCRFKQAMKKSGAEKIDGLNKAKFDIKIIHRFDPTLGGDQWYTKYDRLLKSVESALGETPRGLEALNVAEAQAAAQ